MNNPNKPSGDDMTTELFPEETRVEEEDKSSDNSPSKPWDPKDIRITTKVFTIREIFTQIEEGELDLAPDFQRSFVWKDKQQLRLIESILLGIPLPAFYFNQVKDGAHQVIDGVQRLTTLKRFMSDNLELKEADLEYLKSLQGKKFSSLDVAIRRRFSGTQIVAHVIEPQTPDEVKYDIFSRVNTGGSQLNAQEIRHCMSKTKSRAFLHSLVVSQSFDLVMGRTFFQKDETTGKWVRNDLRMADREMALRFCAFYVASEEDYAKAENLDKFLLQFTKRIDEKFSESEFQETKIAFERAMQNCHTILGNAAFRRWLPGDTRRGPFNRAIFESQAIAFTKYSLEELLPHKEAIQKAFRELFLDATYDNAVRFGTGSPLKVKQRLSKPKEQLEKILRS
jgi:hypothetical protein